MKILTDKELKRVSEELCIPIEKVRTMYCRALSASSSLMLNREEQVKKKCYFCGTILLDKARICDRCGGPVM